MKTNNMNFLGIIALLAIIGFTVTACDTDGNGIKTHTHNLTKTNAVSATCTAAGNPDYWTCSSCSKYFADENGTIELTSSQIVIAIIQHTFGEWEETTPPTYIAKGIKTRDCTLCDVTDTETQTGSSQLQINSITQLETVLSELPSNTASSPYSLLLNINDLTGIQTALISDEIKYVSLDFSGSTFTSIGWYDFYQTGLVDITFPESVTTIPRSNFDFSGILKSINVDINNTNYSSIDGVLFNKDKTSLIAFPAQKDGTYTIPDSVISIGERAFLHSSLTSIIVPINVKSIGSDSFRGSIFTSLSFPGVTSVGNGAFYVCSNLTSLYLPSLTSIDSCAFGTIGRGISLTITLPKNAPTFAGSAYALNTYTSTITIRTPENPIGYNDAWQTEFVGHFGTNATITLVFEAYTP